jgi:opacity protein-like surface antigen
MDRLLKVLFSFALTLLLISHSQAASDENGYFSSKDFKLHGFISQGIIDVNGSDFVNDDESLSTELTELGLNGSYQINANFRLATQLVYLDGGNRYEQGLRVDYALLDWSAYNSEFWQTNIYLGRFKNSHWLYSSSRDIPFARPSIILPQSVYFDGFRDIAVGSDGAAIKISHSDDDSGNFDFSLSFGKSPISDEQTNILMGEAAQGIAKQDHDAQASLYWQPAFSAWRFGLSLLDADFSYKKNEGFDFFSDANFTFQFYTVNALYEGEFWELSGEIYQQRFITDGFYSPIAHVDNVGRGYYAQTRYKLTSDITLLARYEDFYLNEDDKDGKILEATTGIPYYFAFHKDITLGLSYDVTSNVKIRAEYHWSSGAGRLTPVVLPNPAVNNSKNWEMWAVQLMYWF